MDLMSPWRLLAASFPGLLFHPEDGGSTLEMLLYFYRTPQRRTTAESTLHTDKYIVPYQL
jgi:hypothetical protein